MNKRSPRRIPNDAIAIGSATVATLFAISFGLVGAPGKAATIVATLAVSVTWYAILQAWTALRSCPPTAITPALTATIAVFGAFAVISTVALPGLARPALSVALPLGLILLLAPRILQRISAARADAEATLSAAPARTAVTKEASSPAEPAS